MKYSEKIASQVKKYLDEQGWSHDFEKSEELGIFKFGINLDTKIQQVDMLIIVDTAGFTVYGIPNVKSDTKSMPRVAEYLTLANYNLKYGNFELDYSDGEIRFKSSILCGESIPDMPVVEHIVDCPLAMWSRYGNDMMAVLFSDISPVDAVKNAEKDESEDSEQE